MPLTTYLRYQTNWKSSFLFSIFFFSFLTYPFIAQAQLVNLTRSTKSIFQKEWVTQIAISPTGKQIAFSGIGGMVSIMDSSSGTVSKEVTLPTTVLTLSFSNDGNLLAAGDAAGTVSIIETESSTVKKTFKADKNIVNTVAFSRDGKYLAAGGNDGITRLWSMADEKFIEEINPARGNIVSLVFADSRLITGTINFKERKGAIEVWDWQNKKSLHVFDEGTPALRGLSVSPDGQTLAAASYRPASRLYILQGEGASFEASLRLLPDLDEPTPVAILDLKTGKTLDVVNSETGARSIAFSPDGKMLACGGANGTVIYDASGTFTEIGRADSQTAVNAVAFSADSKQLYIAREHEPLAQFGAGGLEKLFDPFLMNLTMVVREATKPTFTFESKKNSITGGSDVETWQITQQTKSPETEIWEATRTYFEKKPDEARKTLLQTQKNFPNNGEAHRVYAILFESEDLRIAQTRLETAVKADPNCASCWRTLGEIQFKAKDFSSAVKSFEKVLQLNPEYGLVAGRLADAFAGLALTAINGGNNKKNMDAAEDYLIRALHLRPAEEQYITNLGTVYYFRGDFDKSIELTLLSLKLHPDRARLYYNLGHSYRYKGDKQKALEAYRRYVQMGEKGEEERVERAKEFISQLSK